MAAGILAVAGEEAAGAPVPTPRRARRTPESPSRSPRQPYLNPPPARHREAPSSDTPVPELDRWCHAGERSASRNGGCTQGAVVTGRESSSRWLRTSFPEGPDLMPSLGAELIRRARVGKAHTSPPATLIGFRRSRSVVLLVDGQSVGAFSFARRSAGSVESNFPSTASWYHRHRTRSIDHDSSPA